MDDKKITPEGEPKFSSIQKWLENFWYHYKVQTIIAVVAIVTVVISTVQLLNKEEYDYYLLYAGPSNIAIQDIVFMEAAVEEFADDYDKNGEVSVAIDDVVMLSPEEQQAAIDAGAVLNGDFMSTTMNSFYQQIIGGDAVICMLSPYMYSIVHDADGFLPLSEIFVEIPDSAYDDCGIVLSKTDFGKYYNGINDLPEDTVLCIRRVSTMAKIKGEKKTRAAHAANLEMFKRMVEFESPAFETME